MHTKAEYNTMIEFDALLNLMQLIGVSGNEKKVMDYIASLIKNGEKCFDHIGNMFLKRKNSRYLLVAHVDEVGIRLDKKIGNLMFEFSTIGRIHDCSLQNAKFVFKNNAIGEVVLLNDNFRVIKFCETLDTSVQAGEIGGFNSISKLNCDQIFGKAIDNRLGCYLAIKLYEKFDSIDVVFTTQEEIGLRGSKALNLDKLYEGIIVLDCIAEDGAVMTGKGPIIVKKDGLANYKNELTANLEAIASGLSDSHQILSTNHGATEGAALVVKRCGNVSVVCVPIMNSHSGDQRVLLSDIESTRLLLWNLFQNKLESETT